MPPIPKRSDQRRRRNLDQSVPDKVTVTGPAVKPPPIRREIHPLARRWYKSLAQSGQSRFYEASDWALALVVAEAINDYMAEAKAAKFAGILAGSSLLLTTEGDRRRMRLELTREAVDDDDDAAAAAVDHWLKAVD
jgi:hypothetical protein